MSFSMFPASMAAFGVLAAGAVVSPATAHSGEWRFHAERCPDLVEDYRDRRESRRDERYNRGPLDRIEDRADRRESRRDESVTICPASAWVWHGAKRHRTARPASVRVYYDTRARHYYRFGPKRVQVNVVIS